VKEIKSAFANSGTYWNRPVKKYFFSGSFCGCLYRKYFFNTSSFDWIRTVL